MAIAAVSCLPSRIESGNTYNVLENIDPIYPNNLWTLQIVLSLLGQKVVAINATASGTGFAYTLPINLNPGLYDYAKYVTETASGQRTTTGKGTLEVIPNLLQTTPTSTAQTILANIETAIQKLSSGSNQSVSFNGQSFTKKDLKNLTDQRTYWKAEVLREQSRINAQRRGYRRDGEGRVGVRFMPEIPIMPAIEHF